MKIAYFVHDLTDPAVLRRVRMLQAGGAEPIVLGFRRADQAPKDVAGAPAVDLGRTFDAQLSHRARATVLTMLKTPRFKGLLAGAEAVMARTLEMLAIAEAARTACGVKAPLVYECLDIHRLMLKETAKGRAMRALERALMRRASLLIVSSPAFLESYFRSRQGVGSDLPIPSLLVENKVLELGGTHPPPPPAPAAGPPWRIGWMGAIRCRKSLDILAGLASRRPDLVEVHIHGRPAYTEFRNFDAQVAATENVFFHGPYTAEDLPRLYGQTHFAWAIDYMEEGLNSAWLLPNRVYEAGRYGAVPIALREVQTGRFLQQHGFGVRLRDPRELEGFFEQLTPAAYKRLRQELEAAPLETFIADERACRELVRALVDAGREADAESAAGELGPTVAA